MLKTAFWLVKSYQPNVVYWCTCSHKICNGIGSELIYQFVEIVWELDESFLLKVEQRKDLAESESKEAHVHAESSSTPSTHTLTHYTHTPSLNVYLPVPSTPGEEGTGRCNCTLICHFTLVMILGQTWSSWPRSQNLHIQFLITCDMPTILILLYNENGRHGNHLHHIMDHFPDWLAKVKSFVAASDLKFTVNNNKVVFLSNEEINVRKLNLE